MPNSGAGILYTKIHNLLLTNTHLVCIIVNEKGEHTKRKDLISLLEKNGWEFKRDGANHDVYEKNGIIEAIPRHREISEVLAKAIIKRRGAEISPLLPKNINER